MHTAPKLRYLPKSSPLCLNRRPGRSCCPGAGGTNRGMARKSWVWDGVLLSQAFPWHKAAGWGSAKPKSHPGQPSGLGGASRHVPGLAVKQHKGTSPRAALPKAPFPPFPQCLSQTPQAGGEPDSLLITAITHPHTWLWSVEKKGIALIFQQFRARSPCWHGEL